MEYGIGYARDNQSPALANLLETVADVAPPLETPPPEGRVTVQSRKSQPVMVAGANFAGSQLGGDTQQSAGPGLLRYIDCA
jgi:hypothetical protein